MGPEVDAISLGLVHFSKYYVEKICSSMDTSRDYGNAQNLGGKLHVSIMLFQVLHHQQYLEKAF